MSGDVTQLLQRWGDGDAFERLMPLVYDELRKLAAGHLQGERDGHTLNPTGLVHEAYRPRRTPLPFHLRRACR